MLILWSGACAHHCSHSKFLGKPRLHYHNATHPDNLVISLIFSAHWEWGTQSIGADETPGAVAWLGHHVSVCADDLGPTCTNPSLWSRPSTVCLIRQHGVQRFGCRTKHEHGEIIITELLVCHIRKVGEWVGPSVRNRDKKSKSLHHHQCSWTNCTLRSFLTFVQQATEDLCHHSDSLHLHNGLRYIICHWRLCCQLFFFKRFYNECSPLLNKKRVWKKTVCICKSK